MNDDNNISNGAGEPQNIPDVPIDQGMASRVMDLYSRVDEVLNELNVPEREKKEVEQNLMEAIAADLLTRLGSKLSDEEKGELANMAETIDTKEPDLNSVAGFFRGKFSQEDLVNELAEATESVLEDFVKEMAR